MCGGRSAVEHYMRSSKAERRRAEKLLGGGSLGRSFSRSYAGGLQREPPPPSEEEEDAAAAAAERDKGSRRSSLRVSLSPNQPSQGLPA